MICKPKPAIGNRKEKFIFYSAITGGMQHLERLSRVSYIERMELESCLLSRSTLSSMIGLLPRLGLIAGGQVESEYGIFRFNLGPGDEDKYHEITAVGMNE